MRGFAGPEVLAPIHLLLGSTSWYLPALAYESDRDVTDVVSVMSCQSCVMSAVCLSLELYWWFSLSRNKKIKSKPFNDRSYEFQIL